MPHNSTAVVEVPASSLPSHQAASAQSDIPRWVRLARKVWLKIHLYIGLAVGLELALVGLTGGVLVFYKDVDVG